MAGGALLDDAAGLSEGLVLAQFSGPPMVPHDGADDGPVGPLSDPPFPLKIVRVITDPRGAVHGLTLATRPFVPPAWETSFTVKP